MSHRARFAVCAAAVAVALTPAQARADKIITAETVWHFDAMDYTIDQGEKLTFVNQDAQSPGPHNVTSKDTGSDGSTPLFHSATIKNGEQSVVEGAQQLKTGQYSFDCTVHPFMTATLHVTANGTPLPASGSSPSPSPPASSPDTAKPEVLAALRTSSLRALLRAGVVRARVTASEQVALRLSLTARSRGRTVTVARGSATDAAAGKARNVSFKLTSSGRRLARARRRLAVTLVVAATDQAGNTTTTHTRRTLRR